MLSESPRFGRPDAPRQGVVVETFELSQSKGEKSAICLVAGEENPQTPLEVRVTTAFTKSNSSPMVGDVERL